MNYTDLGAFRIKRSPYFPTWREPCVLCLPRAAALIQSINQLYCTTTGKRFTRNDSRRREKICCLTCIDGSGDQSLGKSHAAQDASQIHHQRLYSTHKRRRFLKIHFLVVLSKKERLLKIGNSPWTSRMHLG